MDITAIQILEEKLKKSMIILLLKFANQCIQRHYLSAENKTCKQLKHSNIKRSSGLTNI